MFVFHRHARRDETLREVRGELFVALRIPAQQGQLHGWRADGILSFIGIVESKQLLPAPSTRDSIQLSERCRRLMEDGLLPDAETSGYWRGDQWSGIFAS
jgi:hypothetical protein